MKNKLIYKLLILYTRYLLGLAFAFAGISKVLHKRFASNAEGIIGIENTPFRTPDHLFETLYQAEPYWIFIGLGQIIAAFLIMTQRFAKVGQLLFFVIISNIMVITFSYPGTFNLTKIITLLMFLANILLILYNWDYLLTVLGIKTSYNNSREKTDLLSYKIWEIGGLILYLWNIIFIGFFIEETKGGFVIWIGLSFLICLISLIFGLRKYYKKSKIKF